MHLQSVRKVANPTKNMFRSMREKLVTDREPVAIFKSHSGQYMQATVSWAKELNMFTKYKSMYIKTIHPHGEFRKNRNNQKDC